MNKLRAVLVTAFGSLVLASSAQDTNALKTDLGVFESQTGVIIIKGHDQIGSLAVGAITISVHSKENIDTSTGRKAHGLAIELVQSPLPKERFLVDYDEIDPLLNSINYLNNITYDVTPLSSFEAGYRTKSGLRMVAHSIKRQGAIQTYLEYNTEQRILLSSIQMKEFYGLIEGAKKQLDSIRAAK